MRNFYILSKGQKSYSANRLKEELKKYDYNVYHLNFNDLIISEEGLFWKDKLIVLTPADIFWCVNNSTLTRFALSSVENEQKSFLWPNPEVFHLANKFKANRFFAKIGVKTPKTVLISSFDYKKIIEKTGLIFPMVLKKNYGSKGESVYLVKNFFEIEKEIKGMFLERSESTPIKNSTFILQEFISEAQSSDYRVLCLKSDIIGGIKRVAKEGFKANIALGGKAEKFVVEKDLAEICRNIMQKSKAFYAGIDFIKSDKGWLAIEINTCAQFEGFEKATGINVAGKIIDKFLE